MSWENVSPFPLLVEGVAAYVKPKQGGSLKRYFVPLTEPVVMAPGATANANRNYETLLSRYGDPVSSWAVYRRVDCENCLNAIERDVLVSPAMTSRTELPIEVIPNVFSEYSLFKVLVEVRSDYFSASGDVTEVRGFALRADGTRTTVPLFLDRDTGGEPFEYRIKIFHDDGRPTRVSDWHTSGGVMDITVHAGLLRSLVDSDE